MTVDCVVICDGSILLIRRKYKPFKNYLALPGGHVDIGEKTEDACIRELYEETGLKLTVKDLKLLDVFSDPKRDNRRHTITIAYYTLLKKKKELVAGDDAVHAEFVRNWKKKKLAFDHMKIIKKAVKKYYE